MNFRVMLGAGVSKIGTRASACWRQWTCLATHYFTAPFPTPLALFAHATGLRVHMFETLMNHLVELVMPFAFLVPLSAVQAVNGALQLGFQCAILTFGSYAQINWITMTTLVMCFDDDTLATAARRLRVTWLLAPPHTLPAAATTTTPATTSTVALNAKRNTDDEREHSEEVAAANLSLGDNDDGCRQRRHDAAASFAPSSPASTARATSSSSPSAAVDARSTLRASIGWLRFAVQLACAVWIGSMSVAPVRELLSPSPWLQTYSPYHLVNAYGVFGFVNSKRYVLELSYTHANSSVVDTNAWQRLHFGCLPTDTHRRPCWWVSPCTFLRCLRSPRN